MSRAGERKEATHVYTLRRKNKKEKARQHNETLVPKKDRNPIAFGIFDGRSHLSRPQNGGGHERF